MCWARNITLNFQLGQTKLYAPWPHDAMTAMAGVADTSRILTDKTRVLTGKTRVLTGKTRVLTGKTRVLTP